MAAITYDEIREDLKEVADILEDNNVNYKAFNKGYQFNAMDIEGIWHSYYPTTQKVLLHHSNEWRDRKTMTIEDVPIEKFIKGIKTPNLTKLYFKED